MPPRRGAAIFVSGIDLGWALDTLPLLLSGIVADVREIRVQEIFNYARYDQPDVVWNLIGFAMPMGQLPPMLTGFSLRLV
jgi:hypothetical protein